MIHSVCGPRHHPTCARSYTATLVLSAGLFAAACESRPAPADLQARTPNAERRQAAPGGAPESAARPPAPTAAPGAAPESEDRALCDRLCHETVGLHCGMDLASCTSNCLNLITQSGCPKESRAFLACAAKRDAADFECDEGMPSLKAAICEAEQAGVMGCMEKGT